MDSKQILKRALVTTSVAWTLTLVGLCPAPIKDPRGMNQTPKPESTDAQLAAQQGAAKTLPQVGKDLNADVTPKPIIADPKISDSASSDVAAASHALDHPDQTQYDVYASEKVHHKGPNVFMGFSMLLLGLLAVQVVRLWASKPLNEDNSTGS